MKTKSELVAAVLPIIAKLYRFREEEDIDRLADALELFADAEPAAPDAPEDRSPEAAPEAAKARTEQCVAAGVSEETIRKIAEETAARIAERMDQTFGALKELPERVEQLADKMATPGPETTEDAEKEVFSPMQRKIAEAARELTEKQQAALLTLIDGGDGLDRLAQAAALIRLEADELSDKSEEYKALLRMAVALTEMIRERSQNGGKRR